MGIAEVIVEREACSIPGDRGAGTPTAPSPADASARATRWQADGATIGRRIGCSMCRLTNGAAIVRCAGALLLSKPSTG